MELVIFVVMLAVLEFVVFSALVGYARGKYGVLAPAVSGHEMFDRYFRVQQNTLEQLVAFIPVIFCFAWVTEQHGWYGYELAAGAGMVWLVGRVVYAVSYIREPASRSAGFLMTFLPVALMLVSTLVIIIVQ